MNGIYDVFEYFSVASGVGVSALSVSGQPRFKSSVYLNTENAIQKLYNALDCEEACHISLLYSLLQARRFAGCYIFFAPSGLAYCTSPIQKDSGEMSAGVVAGPLLMTSVEEYLEIDVRCAPNEDNIELIREALNDIPIKTPAQVRAISEQLHVCATHFSGRAELTHVVQADVLAAAYPIEKENELLAAISVGDIHSAGAIINDILGQILFHSDNNLEILRSRVFELTVLLSRAALKGGANMEAIFGLNYSFLREIDMLSSVDDTVQWLHGVTRRFAQNVFDFANAKHVDIIYKAVAFIKKNYSERLSLQDVADHVFLSPTYFSKIFREETGQTPGAYITGVRIEESRRLLRDLCVNIADIPELVGFESQSYFTRVFKKSEGCTPGRFRQKYLERNTNA